MSNTIKNITTRLQAHSIAAADDSGSRKVTLVNKDSKAKTPLSLTYLLDDVKGNKLYYGEWKSPRGFMVNKIVVLDSNDRVVAIGSAWDAKARLIKLAQEEAQKAAYWGEPWYLNVRNEFTLA